MAGQYFYARGDQQFGPFSGARLKELATSGCLEPTDTVWKHGMQERVRAGTMQSLFPTAPPAACADESAPVMPLSILSKPASPSSDTLESPEPTLELVPIEEDPEPPASSDPDAREKTIPVPGPSSKGRTPERKRRAEAIQGAIIVSQDGDVVHYRKKCSKCGHQSTNKNSMPIRTGSTTASFFCPKCKKLRDVVIRGTS